MLSLDFTYSTEGSPNYSNLNLSSQSGSTFGEIIGHAGEQLSLGSQCSSQGDTCCDGIHLDETGAGQLRLVSQALASGAVLSVCSYLDQFILASAGNTVSYHSRNSFY